DAAPLDRAGAFVAPRDPLELQLTQLWEMVLRSEPIGVRDNFFELGGHSLLAMRLMAQIETSWGQRLPLATLLQAPTVEQLAGLPLLARGTLFWQPGRLRDGAATAGRRGERRPVGVPGRRPRAAAACAPPTSA